MLRDRFDIRMESETWTETVLLGNRMVTQDKWATSG